MYTRLYFIAWFSLCAAIAPLSAQADSTNTASWNWSATLASTNFFRGVDYGQHPSLITTLNFTPGSWDFGLLATYNLNGKRAGFGNTVSAQASYAFSEQLSLGLVDYYFFSPADEENDFWNWGNDQGQHFLEAQLRYAPIANLQLLAAWNFYGAGFYGSVNEALYLEARYQWGPVAAFGGYLTAPSVLHFTDKAGINNLGLEYAHVFSLPKTELILGGQLIYNAVADFAAPIEKVNGEDIMFIAFVSLVPKAE